MRSARLNDKATARSCRDRVSGGTSGASQRGDRAIRHETRISPSQRNHFRGPPNRQKLGNANRAVSQPAQASAESVLQWKISGNSTSNATNNAQA